MPAPRNLLLLVMLAVIAAAPTCPGAERMSADQAWKALPEYAPGHDMGPLLAIDREVIAAMQSPRTRAACAAKLAELLGQDKTTRAARQYICLQLRQVGTSAEVPLLSRLLMKPETAEIARYALESIPGDQAAAALRAGLTSLQGESLLGVVNSVAARKDRRAVAALQELANASDQTVGNAAIRALGSIVALCGCRRTIRGNLCEIEPRRPTPRDPPSRLGRAAQPRG